jgi:hypothetical protein
MGWLKGREIMDETTQHIAHKRLLAAVIGLAIDDACKGSSNVRMVADARSAFNFLFEHSDGYLSLLDIDPQQFRVRLLNYTYLKNNKLATPYDLTEMQRRGFRINYKRWLKEKSYGYADVCAEEDDDVKTTMKVR